jgi:hypothetical protein
MKPIDSFIYKLIEQGGRTGNALKTMGKMAAGAALGVGAHQMYKQNQAAVDQFARDALTKGQAVAGQAARGAHQVAAGRPAITADPKDTSQASPPKPSASPPTTGPASGEGELAGQELAKQQALAAQQQAQANAQAGGVPVQPLHNPMIPRTPDINSDHFIGVPG